MLYRYLLVINDENINNFSIILNKGESITI
jgi:hypothetical protein